MNKARATYLQKLLIAQGYPIAHDGVWGRKSQAALDVFYKEHGQPMQGWGVVTRDILFKLKRNIPDKRVSTIARIKKKRHSDSVIRSLPHSTKIKEMTAYYGDPERDIPHRLTNVVPPFPIYYDHNKVSYIRFHDRAAAALYAVLNTINDTFSAKEIRQLELDQYSGAYNKRYVRGGTYWSTHAYACAIDWNAIKNRLSWRADRALFAQPEYDEWRAIWREFGFVNLGEALGYDWMHMQYASV